MTARESSFQVATSAHATTTSSVSATAGLAGCASSTGELETKRGRRVVVVGGGWGGATAAKYVRIADPTIEVTPDGLRLRKRLLTEQARKQAARREATGSPS